MGESNESDFLAANVVDDAVGKFPNWEAAPTVPPERPDLGMCANKREHSFEFCDERKTDFGAAFPRVEHGAIAQFLVSLGTDRRRHLIAARARAMDSAAGINAVRPLSIS